MAWCEEEEESHPELLEVSATAASLQATQNTAGSWQSQPISISAVAWLEYKAVDQRERRMRHRLIFPLCVGEKFDFSLYSY